MVIAVLLGTNEANLVHRPSHLGQEFADMQAGDIARDALVLSTNLLVGFGFEVEGIMVGQTAAQIDKNDGFGASITPRHGGGEFFRRQQTAE